MTRSLTVRATGALALVQDLGRTGLGEIGVGRSGAADRASLRQGNRALGNDEGAAAIEVTFGGLDVEVGRAPLWLCVTGARGEVFVDGRDVGSHAVVAAPAGSRVSIGPPASGLRSYLCVRGGLDVACVLGSRSHDVLAGLGPAPLSPGDVLAVGAARGDLPGVDGLFRRESGNDVVLRAVRGPRHDWVREPDLLVRTKWLVTGRSNRIGTRLAGALFERATDESLPSEGAWRGAVQVPPSGEPVLFLADHPVTGGYPVVAVVVDDDVDRAAQVRPGQSLSFTWVRAP